MANSRRKPSTNQAISIAQPTIHDVIAALDKEVKQYGNLSDSKYKTSGEVPGYKNIREQTDIRELIKLAGAVVSSERMYLEGAKILEKTTFPAYTINGSLVEEIIYDIKLREAIITHKEKVEELEALRAEGASLLTEQEKKEAFMLKVMSKLNKE